MRFRTKIALSVTCLLAVLFGIGGSIWIAASFHTSFNRQKADASDAVNLTVDMVQTLGEYSGWEDEDGLQPHLQQNVYQLWEQGIMSSFLSLSVSVGGVTLFHLGDTVDPNSPQGQECLFLEQTLAVNDMDYRFSFVYDISSVYETRQIQFQVYVLVYLGLILVCAVLSYTIAWFLTRPLKRLAKASREIASGNLSCRSRVTSRDEIGRLSREFDAMADQVEQSVEQLKQSMEQQERFMGSFTHELKTPMTSIIGYADLLRSHDLTPEEQAEAAEYIFSEAKRLERMSMTLLDLFVTGKQSVPLRSCEPGVLVEDYVRRLAPVYAQQGIDLNCEVQPGSCLLEPDLFVTLTANLIDNARKALPSRGGRILVILEMTEDGCRLIVQDNGRGIPQDSLKHLTEAFYRVDKSRSRAQGGSGLGLALCENIVKLHGGELYFQSKQNQGTDVVAQFRGGRT